MTEQQKADVKWLNKAEHYGEWERFEGVTGERESIWMMKSKASPKVRFYAVGKGQVGKEHPTLVSATYWAYGTGYLGVIDDPSEIFLEIACRNEVQSGGAVRQG